MYIKSALLKTWAFLLGGSYQISLSHLKCTETANAGLTCIMNFNNYDIEFVL